MRLRARALSLYERAESPDFRVYARYRAAFIARAQDGRAEGFHGVSIGGTHLCGLWGLHGELAEA